MKYRIARERYEARLEILGVGHAHGGAWLERIDVARGAPSVGRGSSDKIDSRYY